MKAHEVIDGLTAEDWQEVREVLLVFGCSCEDVEDKDLGSIIDAMFDDAFQIPFEIVVSNRKKGK